MAAYSIFFKASVWKDVRKIPKKDVQHIMATIASLEENSRLAGCENLTGLDRYRVRWGRYRIVYSIQEQELTIWVVKAGHRKDIHRQL